MSAIIAGKKCKGCGFDYWTSFGHPEWYDKVVKHGKNPNNIYLHFLKIRKSGFCFVCFMNAEERGEI